MKSVNKISPDLKDRERILEEMLETGRRSGWALEDVGIVVLDVLSLINSGLEEVECGLYLACPNVPPVVGLRVVVGSYRTVVGCATSSHDIFTLIGVWDVASLAVNKQWTVDTQPHMWR